MNNIDYDALKKRGFLRQKQEGFFVLRTQGAIGNYNAEQMSIIGDISKKFGRGIIHATTRQGLEIPFIKFEDIDNVQREAQAAGIKAGISGPRVRAITCCPGNSWCKRGLVSTFGLFERIEKEIKIERGIDLPHKFKIAISGCPNACTRPQVSEIGVHGQIDATTSQNKIGYAIYLGGCGGRTPHVGFKLDGVFTEDEVLKIIQKVIAFYKENAKPRQRFALLINEIGKNTFFRNIGL